MKPILFFFAVLSTTTQLDLYGHGFSASTYVKCPPGNWQCIEQICCRSKKEKHVAIVSYRNGVATAEVTSAAMSQTNCYFRIGFDEYFNDDILCTPTQEFYLPLLNKWVPAYMLKVGDILLSEGVVHKPITHIEFVTKPLKVFSIEVKDTHNFLVGRHAILTHNMIIPCTLMAGLSASFGSGAAAGGSAGSFFGPLSFFGGALVDGVIGVTVKVLSNKHKMPGYQLSFNVNDVEKYRSNNDCIEQQDCFSSISQPGFGAANLPHNHEKEQNRRTVCGGAGDPEDPNDPDKNKKKNRRSDFEDPTKNNEDNQHGKELFKFTDTAGNHMNEEGRKIPIQIFKEVIENPMHIVKDPRGATNASMYYSQMWKNGKLYNVEVLYDKTTNQIMHFLYKQEAMGPLPKIK